MMRRMVLTLGLVLVSTAAMAGSATLHKGNAKLHLGCDGTGCYATTYDSAGKSQRKRLGEGGSENYKKWKQKYQAQGWH